MTGTLRERAASTLCRNDAGGWTMAAPALYPHQWSWDSAFVAIGWAHLDLERALAELEHLFAAQWANGKLPHIVFNPAGHFPEAGWWESSRSPDAPAPPPPTSGLCQPPVHAIAVERICMLAARADGGLPDRLRPRFAAAYRRLLDWHEYLARERDPDASGLVTIYHPWEGLDNSPRWDEALAVLEVGDLPSYERRDLQEVADPRERPDQDTYDRYIWLVELLKRARYDDAELQRAHPFLIKDVLFSAILVAANQALLALSSSVGAPASDRLRIAAWIERGRRGLAGCWDDELGLCVDQDVRAGGPIRLRTVAGFAPLIAGADDSGRVVEQLDSPSFCGDPRLRWPLPPSTSPEEPSFDRRNYWRGPTWPVINWLLWWALRRGGEHARAADLRRAGLEQVRVGGFAEYFEPFTGEPLGADDQSWTAAVVLDWLDADSDG